MRKIDSIVVHCTATNPSWYADKSAEDAVTEIRRWHTQERGWSDIGYHFVISRKGEIADGRPVERSGAHTRGFNKGSIGVAICGGRGGCADDKFLDNFTEEQATSLRKLLDQLHEDYDIKWVKGHSDFANKACPCFNVEEWYG